MDGDQGVEEEALDAVSRIVDENRRLREQLRRSHEVQLAILRALQQPGRSTSPLRSLPDGGGKDDANGGGDRPVAVAELNPIPIPIPGTEASFEPLAQATSPLASSEEILSLLADVSRISEGRDYHLPSDFDGFQLSGFGADAAFPPLPPSETASSLGKTLDPMFLPLGEEGLNFPTNMSFASSAIKDMDETLRDLGNGTPSNNPSTTVNSINTFGTGSALDDFSSLLGLDNGVGASTW
ncbi:hypothetical protein HK405_002290, partial [Cladochytrium tenue]